MPEDFAHDGWLDDEREDLHLRPAGAQPGIGFVDPADELCPSSPQPPPVGPRGSIVGRRGVDGDFASGRCLGGSAAAATSRDVSVVAVVAHEVESGRGDVHE